VRKGRNILRIFFFYSPGAEAGPTRELEDCDPVPAADAAVGAAAGVVGEEPERERLLFLLSRSLLFSLSCQSMIPGAVVDRMWGWWCRGGK